MMLIILKMQILLVVVIVLIFIQHMACADTVQCSASQLILQDPYEVGSYYYPQYRNKETDAQGSLAACSSSRSL